jgi:hypothetical protein
MFLYSHHWRLNNPKADWEDIEYNNIKMEKFGVVSVYFENISEKKYKSFLNGVNFINKKPFSDKNFVKTIIAKCSIINSNSESILPILDWLEKWLEDSMKKYNKNILEDVVKKPIITFEEFKSSIEEKVPKETMKEAMKVNINTFDDIKKKVMKKRDEYDKMILSRGFSTEPKIVKNDPFVQEVIRVGEKKRNKFKYKLMSSLDSTSTNAYKLKSLLDMEKIYKNSRKKAITVYDVIVPNNFVDIIKSNPLMKNFFDKNRLYINNKINTDALLKLMYLRIRFPDCYIKLSPDFKSRNIGSVRTKNTKRKKQRRVFI